MYGHLIKKILNAQNLSFKSKSVQLTDNHSKLSQMNFRINIYIVLRIFPPKDDD